MKQEKKWGVDGLLTLLDWVALRVGLSRGKWKQSCDGKRRKFGVWRHDRLRQRYKYVRPENGTSAREVVAVGYLCIERSPRNEGEGLLKSEDIQ